MRSCCKPRFLGGLYEKKRNVSFVKLERATIATRCYVPNHILAVRITKVAFSIRKRVGRWQSPDMST